jgi:glutathione reductase (NADPH)
MSKSGIHFECHASVTAIKKEADGTLTVSGHNGGASKTPYADMTGVDVVLYAVGRVPLTFTPDNPDVLNLKKESVGVTVSPSGLIPVDDDHNTNVKGVYAIGDVIGKADLTPVALAAGRALATRLFYSPDGKNGVAGDDKESEKSINYDNSQWCTSCVLS